MNNQTVILFPSSELPRRVIDVRREFPDATEFVILCRSAARPNLSVDFEVKCFGINEYVPAEDRRVVVVFENDNLVDFLRKVMVWCRELCNQIEAVRPTDNGTFESLALIGKD